MLRLVILLVAISLCYCENIQSTLSDVDSLGVVDLCDDIVNDQVDESLGYSNSWMRDNHQDSQPIAGFQLMVPIWDGYLDIGVETQRGKLQNLDSIHRFGDACQNSYYNGKVLRGGLQYDSLLATFDDVDVKFLYWKYKAALSYTVHLGLNFTVDKSPDNCLLTSFEITTKDQPDFQFGMTGWAGRVLAKVLRFALLKHDLTPIFDFVKTESQKSVSSYFGYYWCWNWRYSRPPLY